MLEIVIILQALGNSWTTFRDENNQSIFYDTFLSFFVLKHTAPMHMLIVRKNTRVHLAGFHITNIRAHIRQCW